MKFQRDEFNSGPKMLRPGVAALCHSAEGGTSGKNSQTDQRQQQLTTGTTGANSPNLTASEGGTANTGVQIAGNATFTDAGVIDRAFDFGDSIAGNLSKAYSESAAAGAATSKFNTDFLSSSLSALSAQTDAGQAANNNKTLMILGAGLLVLAFFIFRR